MVVLIAASPSAWLALMALNLPQPSARGRLRRRNAAGATPRRINRQNQEAILRLMNELGDLADGDLTVRATVSEDITGAIADSVNYTIEELRCWSAHQRRRRPRDQASEAGAADLRPSCSPPPSASRRRSSRPGAQVLGMARRDDRRFRRRASQSAKVARQSLEAAARARRR
jgi:twitching motility protein PilJ